jgi:hypothetical protein
MRSLMAYANIATMNWIGRGSISDGLQQDPDCAVVTCENRHAMNIRTVHVGRSSIEAIGVLSALALSCGTAAPHSPTQPPAFVVQQDAFERQCEELFRLDPRAPTDDWECHHDDAPCQTELKKVKAACRPLDLFLLRTRCAQQSARACFVLARIDPSQSVAVIERACALGHPLACSALVASRGEAATIAEGTLARQCERPSAPSCILLAQRREEIAASGYPQRYEVRRRRALLVARGGWCARPSASGSPVRTGVLRAEALGLRLAPAPLRGPDGARTRSAQSRFVPRPRRG